MFRASSSLLDRLGECGLCLGYKMKVGLSWGRGKGGGGLRWKAYSEIRQKEVILGKFPITKYELTRCCLRDEGPI